MKCVSLIIAMSNEKISWLPRKNVSALYSLTPNMDSNQ